jgi:heme/copper-type cytochrome/quinol oxidase subunit 2
MTSDAPAVAGAAGPGWGRMRCTVSDEAGSANRGVCGEAEPAHGLWHAPPGGRMRLNPLHTRAEIRRTVPRLRVEIRAAAAVAAVALLLGVAVAGLRARTGLATLPSRTAAAMAARAVTASFVVITALAVIVAVPLVIQAFRRKQDVPEELKARRRPPRWVSLLLVLIVLSVPGVAHKLLDRLSKLREQLTPHLAGTATPHAASHHSHAAASPTWMWAMVAAAVAVAALFLAAVARRSRAAEETGDKAEPRFEDHAKQRLAAAVSAGSTALRDSGTPRASIIAAYAAMERSLAHAGAPPEASDTPAEVLARAAAGGLVRSDAAGALTRLFRLARYSPHPVTRGDRAAAGLALHRLHADLAQLGTRERL